MIAKINCLPSASVPSQSTFAKIGCKCFGWCLGRESNPHSPKDRGILSPLRLPIPPPRQIAVARNLYVLQKSLSRNTLPEIHCQNGYRMKNCHPKSCRIVAGNIHLFMEIFFDLCKKAISGDGYSYEHSTRNTRYPDYRRDVADDVASRRDRGRSDYRDTERQDRFHRQRTDPSGA